MVRSSEERLLNISEGLQYTWVVFNHLSFVGDQSRRPGSQSYQKSSHIRECSHYRRIQVYTASKLALCSE